MNTMPEKLLLRRGEVRASLGITKWEMEKLVEERVLEPVRLRDRARAFFRRTDVIALLNNTKRS